MKENNAIKIMMMAQGSCGIIDLLKENLMAKDLQVDNPEAEAIFSTRIEEQLLTALQFMCHELHELTEDLPYKDFVKKRH